MANSTAFVRGVAPLAALLCAMGLIAGGEASRPTTPKDGASAAKLAAPGDKSAAGGASSRSRPAYVTETVRGRVVWLEDALKRNFGVSTEPSAAETIVVLETAEGKLWPLVPDTRGRAFAVDSRLRDMEVELLVRRYLDVPMIQVIRTFRPKDDGLYEVDYWCDICAIPMYILKPCECCQGPTRLRERRVERGSAGGQ